MKRHFAGFAVRRGVTALPCKVRDPDRKGKVESCVNHAQMTPLKGKKFESLEEAQAYLDHWEERWADTRIHGRTKRQDDSWKGWWGPNPPYHAPTFVLTHYEREPLVMEGGTTFYFVSGGIEQALRLPKQAAGDKDVTAGGGCSTG